MKKLILVALVLVAGFAVWKLKSKPQFEGKGAALREALWEWDRASDDKEKLEIAERVVFYSGLRKVSFGEGEKTPPYSLTEEEEDLASEAEDFFGELQTLAREFEKSLSLDQIKEITEDNPNSIYPRIGAFYTTHPKAKCSRSEYDRLRENLSAEELYTRGAHVGALVQLFEQKHMDSYLENLIELIEEDELEDKYSRLSELYYPYLSKPTEFASKMTKSLRLFSETDEKRLQRYQQNLIKAGVSESNVIKYAITLASKSPHCLAKISIDFVKMAREGLTWERGKKILVALQQKVKNEGSVPDSIYDLKGDIERLYMDGQTHGYYLKRQGTMMVQLFSSGDDYEENTQDDFLIGKASL